MRHVVSALVHNVPGVLSHISGMLASRGYNIDSLAVGETEDPRLSRMTFLVVGDDAVLEQVRGAEKGGSLWKKLVVPDPPGGPSVSHQVGAKSSRFIHLKMESGP